jgi:two-component system, OmpR family, phosphate regulon sensor histidine kinase PhoR
MKRRIRYIFILMTLCILGINIFQGYWLYNTYTLHYQQFTRSATEALFQALQRQQEADAKQLFHTKIDEDEDPNVRYRQMERDIVASDKVILFREDSAVLGTIRDSLRDRHRKERRQLDIIQYYRLPDLPPSALTIPADTLARRISSRLIVNWFKNTPFDLNKMDSVFRKELAMRELEAPFKLDTLHPVSPEGSIPVFHAKAPEAYPVQLRPVPVNPVHNLFVRASFKNPVTYVLRKMGWLLVCSVLLLILTTGCFLYMLSTILRQKKLSEIKNDFINNMTHELKTPIATVSAAVEAMLSFGALENAQKTQLYLNVSRNELQRLSDLVEKVLNMAVEEKKELELHPEPVNLTELIRDIVTHQQLKAAKPVQFEVELPSGEQSVYVDRLHMANTINNLIDNAIKYSYEQVTIYIKSYVEPHAWLLSIKDTGIGIPKPYQQAIFDRFFRVPTGDLHQVKGFGLGLSYVKQVVEKHGGQIEVYSEPAQGSEFKLRFPRDK